VKVLPEQYQYPPGTSLNDALTFETAAGAQVSGNPEVLLYAVDSLSSPAVETVLTGLLRASTGQVRWVALAGLLGRAQAGSLGKVLQEWPAISQDAQSKSYVLDAMDTDFRPEEPEEVHEVVALVQANTTPGELRTALAKVLLAVHTRETLPYFAGLLHSAQLKSRMTGVFGMACFANGNPTQSRSTVKSLAHLMSASSAPYQTPDTLAHMGFSGEETAESEAELVSFWTSWWNQHPELH
jgi:hypothetical protein